MAQAISSIWQGITYRGRDGHYAWMLHRVGGLGILLFLFLHILDIFLIGVGEETFNDFLILYTHPLFKIMEMALIFGVFFHAFNGVRIILVDFWPARFSNLKAQRVMFRIVLVLTVILFIPAAIATVAPFFNIALPWWPA
ncbi:MAG: succinate dehydrogenase, cytochrome b556 subunit [Caldilineales bacterium]